MTDAAANLRICATMLEQRLSAHFLARVPGEPPTTLQFTQVEVALMISLIRSSAEMAEQSDKLVELLRKPAAPPPKPRQLWPFFRRKAKTAP